MRLSNLRVLAPVAILAGGLLSGSDAWADVTGTLLTGSTGSATLSLNSIIFNNDPAATPLGTCTTAVGKGCNSDVATNTTLSFIGGPLATEEGIYVNNNDLTLIAPSAPDANNFLTFASNPNLVFSMNWPLGPGSSNTNCASTTGINGASCSVFAGSPIILTFLNGNTFLGFSVTGKASDTGVAGLKTGSNYQGGFSDFFSSPLPNGTAPTPQNIQLYFCPSGICQPSDFASGKSITSSQSGAFTAQDLSRPPVPEPSTILLSMLGSITMLLVGTGLLKSLGIRA